MPPIPVRRTERAAVTTGPVAALVQRCTASDFLVERTLGDARGTRNASVLLERPGPYFALAPFDADVVMIFDLATRRRLFAARRRALTASTPTYARPSHSANETTPRSNVSSPESGQLTSRRDT
jgi:hypothetical protein